MRYFNYILPLCIEKIETIINLIAVNISSDSDLEIPILIKWNKVSCEMVDSRYLAGNLQKESGTFCPTGYLLSCQKLLVLCNKD